MPGFQTHIIGLIPEHLELRIDRPITITAPAGLRAFIREYPDGPILSSVAVPGNGIPTQWIVTFNDTVIQADHTYWYDLWEEGVAVNDWKHKTGGWFVVPSANATQSGDAFRACGEEIRPDEDRQTYKSSLFGGGYTIPVAKRAGANGPDPGW